MKDKYCEVFFRSGEKLSKVLCTHEPCGEGDAWIFIGKYGREVAIQWFEAIFESEDQTAEVKEVRK